MNFIKRKSPTYFSHNNESQFISGINIKEIDRIEERADPNYSSLPHRENIPEDLRLEVEKDFPIWTCDIKGRCLTGDAGDGIKTVEEIRNFYKAEYGSIDNFKEKLRIEREKFVQEIKDRSEGE